MDYDGPCKQIADGFRTAPPVVADGGLKPPVADGGDKLPCPPTMINPTVCTCGIEVVETTNGCKKSQCTKCDDGWFCSSACDLSNTRCIGPCDHVFLHIVCFWSA